MNVADYIVTYLATRGVTHAFTLSGGMITPLLDACDRDKRIDVVACHHEQAAGFAAEGMARVKGIPGVAFATSGPGATNLLTAIASCYFDSTPAVFLTGQVNRREMRYGQRQRGFQETDIVAMAGPVAKAAWQILDPYSIPSSIDAAWSIALDGRPGPVLLDLPFDVLRATIPNEKLADIGYAERLPVSIPDVVAAIAMLKSAERPLILLGGGCRYRSDAVRRLVNHLWIPAVYSLHGKGVLAEDHPMRIGMIGSYGNRWANWALANCDALLVIGSRLDVRQTGSDTVAFKTGKRVIHVDVDDRELGQCRVETNLQIRGDVGLFSEAAIDHSKAPVNGAGVDVSAWHAAIAERWRAWPAETENEIPAGAINPNTFMRLLGDAACEAGFTSYAVDVGQNQMWAAQSLPVHRGQKWMTSGGHGAMGFALPAAIGSALSGYSTIAIMGDGGFQINSGALHEIAQRQLPIKIVVLDNHGHGMVRQFQGEIYGGRSVATNDMAPCATRVAEAYGIRSRIMFGSGEMKPWIEWLLGNDRPALLELVIPPSVKALPKLSFGKTLNAMDPPRE